MLPPVQAVHCAPLVPQATVVLPARQVLPEQQPAAHEVALHTQPLPVHLRPGPQAAPPLQPQVPPARQVLVVSVLQLAHIEPLAPHAALPGVVHTVPAQHPEPHDVESQTHAPPLQRCPGAHSAELPQRHWPPVQVSARSGLHVLQAAPLLPHAAAVGLETHVEPLQQPPGQVDALQPVQA